MGWKTDAKTLALRRSRVNILKARKKAATSSSPIVARTRAWRYAPYAKASSDFVPGYVTPPILTPDLPPLPPEVHDILIEPVCVTVLERGEDQCAWPLLEKAKYDSATQQRFCGVNIDRRQVGSQRPYCELHAAMRVR
tara:strand:- start:3617 stop:4030 length:414 start_codon:yes stop_codon:yes gene_type:complete